MRKFSLATRWMMCSFLRALLSASLQLARIQTDSIVEMLRALYPELHFEIGKFECRPRVGGSRSQPLIFVCKRCVCSAGMRRRI